MQQVFLASQVKQVQLVLVLLASVAIQALTEQRVLLASQVYLVSVANQVYLVSVVIQVHLASVVIQVHLASQVKMVL